MNNNAEIGQTLAWIGNIPAVMIHHIHILVDDVSKIQAKYEGVLGVDSVELHDVRAFNGCLALSEAARI